MTVEHTQTGAELKDLPERLTGESLREELRETLAAASAAAPDAVVTTMEPTTLRDSPVLHVGWQEPATGVHHDAFAAQDGRLVLVTTDGAYGQPGVYAERTGPGALAGLVPADSNGERMANQLEAALQAELPSVKLTTARAGGLSAEELAELREASSTAGLLFGSEQSQRPSQESRSRREWDDGRQLTARQR